MSTNEITDEDINYFLTTLRKVEGGYPRIRDLRRILEPRLNLFKVNTILRYLERSKRLQTDLDGNIIWIREDNNNANQLSLGERAYISKEFLDYFSKNEKCRSGEGDTGIETEE
ncbi:MAG: hypothetical protein ACRD80_08085 [Nitrososphaeraceae archaeon]